ncbi:peptidase M64 [Flavobacterium sp. xlx-214]|uniref:M64 family metallopeptidase n=1 Tax=unclassified Flavobacterium TaxID=196869 RepID=UPI0013D2DFE1|nr:MULTISPECIES: M64 family metallopeptidase [unclassified Flavobacterium]MBA5793223.1 peptidase M64 [Flavobacterium sp. xlx-221]QMI82494.1 peptidase M64 [Flavobacterium sp. xlx-214]
MRFTYCILFLVVGFFANAQQFNDFFIDKTLRLDYIFGGNANQQNIYLNEMIQLDKWHGRVDNLAVTPIQGNGQIKVYDEATNKLIYVLPFSSLFQEWLTLDQAKYQFKSFENTFLIPYPKKSVRIDVSFYNAKNEEKILAQQLIDPTDVLIRKSTQISNQYEVIHKAKIKNPIKIALVAEGYSESDMDAFMEYAQKTKENLFKHKIFNKYQDSFEIVAVKTVSKESGISIPSKNIWLNTAVQSNFDTFYSNRYLTTLHTKLLHNQLESIPYQHIIILANTDFYGGGGILNSYSLTTTKNKEFAPVVVHEFGHSFAGLADEYFYAQDVFENKASLNTEPWEKNITSLVDFSSKWKSLVDENTVVPTPNELSKEVKIGVFEGLKGNGLYIPTLTCRMKINNTEDFCPVCNNAIEEMILFYTQKKVKK